MHPYSSQFIAEARMKEFHREAARARLAAQVRPPAANRLRMRVGSWLIGAGEMLVASAPVRAVELHR